MFQEQPRQRARRWPILVACAAAIVSSVARAEPPINTLKPGLFGGRSDTAIVGYDPVAYFTDGKPIKGTDSYVYEWKGAKWKFASQDHLDKFKADPDKYAPQYGGYCAYGVANDHLVSIEPDKFTVLNGKLYLNYDAGVQKKWLVDPAGYIKQADAKFNRLLKQ